MQQKKVYLFIVLLPLHLLCIMDHSFKIIVTESGWLFILQGINTGMSTEDRGLVWLHGWSQWLTMHCHAAVAAIEPGLCCLEDVLSISWGWPDALCKSLCKLSPWNRVVWMCPFAIHTGNFQSASIVQSINDIHWITYHTEHQSQCLNGYRIVIQVKMYISAVIIWKPLWIKCFQHDWVFKEAFVGLPFLIEH